MYSAGVAGLVGYGVDFAQRSVLFWDAIRERGNNWIAHEAAGKPPVLAYRYEMLADGRRFERPVNHALVRIIPPKGIEVDDRLRPYVIIDPRAGHGPGIGGFKEDSEVGVALSAGHPVYFVIFYPEPEPGQTLADVTDAEAEFVRMVAERHPESAKPVLVGNCQGGCRMEVGFSSKVHKRQNEQKGGQARETLRVHTNNFLCVWNQCSSRNVATDNIKKTRVRMAFFSYLS